MEILGIPWHSLAFLGALAFIRLCFCAHNFALYLLHLLEYLYSLE